MNNILKDSIIPVEDNELNNHHLELKKQIESSGYHLNPDAEFTKSLLKSIILNEKRYGYGACPCRLAVNDKKDDLDIICPCDYRDPDLDEYGACYCGLYISGEILKGKSKLKSIPERRLSPEQREILKNKSISEILSSFTTPMWRCKVCGYLCTREQPP